MSSQQILQLKKYLISKSYNYMVIILLSRNSDKEIKYFTVSGENRKGAGCQKINTTRDYDVWLSGNFHAYAELLQEGESGSGVVHDIFTLLWRGIKHLWHCVNHSVKVILLGGIDKGEAMKHISIIWNIFQFPTLQTLLALWCNN